MYSPGQDCLKGTTIVCCKVLLRHIHGHHYYILSNITTFSSLHLSLRSSQLSIIIIFPSSHRNDGFLDFL
ncbi:hypothetical protein IMY05_016G0013700 [Salix suchowensis]|nr:hypothetical protein IMY05_016G0013700 [Salix suchowensis]